MIKELAIMGGAYGVTEYDAGNVTPVAEFNIYADPEAAKIVFESEIPLQAVGLDVTMDPKNQLTLKNYTNIKKNKGRVTTFAAKILNKNIHKHRIFALHDPMTVATKIKPSLFEYDRYKVQVETRGEITAGMAVADRRAWLPEVKTPGKKMMIWLFLDRLTSPMSS